MNLAEVIIHFVSICKATFNGHFFFNVRKNFLVAPKRADVLKNNTS